jgi:hypothetical protein
MTTITSLRSEIFQALLSLQTEVKEFQKQIERLIKQGSQVTQFFARKAAPLLHSTAKGIATIVRYRVSDEHTLVFLKEATLTFNCIVVRCAEYAPSIATKALTFYQKLVALLPTGTALQLELLGQGDYRREFEPPTLMLANIAQWWNRHGQSWKSPQLKREPQHHEQPVQLCLDFEAVQPVHPSEDFEAIDQKSTFSLPHKLCTCDSNTAISALQPWQKGDRVTVEGGCLGTITAIKRKKALIEWENGYKAEYTFTEMKRYRYQKIDSTHLAHTG